MGLATCTSENTISAKRYKHVLECYMLPSRLYLFFKECNPYLRKTKLNYILHLLQQHGFVVEDSRCLIQMPFPSWKHLVHHEMQNTSRRAGAIEQLESYIRQEWVYNPLAKIQQLVTSIPRQLPMVDKRTVDSKLGPVPTFWDVLLPSNSRWTNILHGIVTCLTSNICYVIIVLVWMK